MSSQGLFTLTPPAPTGGHPLLTRGRTVAGQEHVIAGSIFGGLPTFGELPPLIPLPEKGEARPDGAPVAAMEWETEVVVHPIHWHQVDADRRHSGWAEVERKWARKQEQNQQQLLPQQQQQQEQEQQARAAQMKGVKSSGPSRGDAKAMMLFPYPNLAIPALNLVSDFRMRVKLNSQSASMAVGDGFKKWTTFTEGEWSGQLGHGIVISGGQDSQDLKHGKTLATQVEASHRLKTADEIPAFIECKSRGFQTGPPDVMRALRDPATADSADASLVQYRVTLSMKTTDERYAEKVNFGLWVGSCLWRGSEVIYDVYSVT
ncbi:hypothetical protein F5B17DRAFT_417011 [Nemania serpens]|nr:hypothetical protein F5B17DRAFT_417011 [Nemania serpens]